MSTTQSVRQLCAAAQARDISTAEATTRDVASFLLSGADPKASFISYEGFLLSHAHAQLLLQQQSSSSSSFSQKEQKEQETKEIEKIRTLFSCLMPTGKCGILSAAATSSSENAETTTNNINDNDNISSSLRNSLNELSEKNPNTKFGQIINVVLKWFTSHDADRMTASSVSDCSNQLAEILEKGNNTTSNNQNNTTTTFFIELPSSPLGLQYLLFLISSRLEWLCFQKSAQTQKQALEESKKKLLNAVIEFETGREVIGVLRPFVSFATNWYQSRGNVEAKSLAGECVSISLSNNTTNTENQNKNKKHHNAVRRQREGEGEEQKDNENEDQEQEEDEETKHKRKYGTDIPWKLFEEKKLNDRLNTHRSVSETGFEDGQYAVTSSIPGDVEFNGTSSYARDVDRLIPTLRNLIFSSRPFDNKSHNQFMAIAFERNGRNFSSSSTDKNSAAVENRVVVPVGESSTSKTPLERVATKN